MENLAGCCIAYLRTEYGPVGKRFRFVEREAVRNGQGFGESGDIFGVGDTGSSEIVYKVTFDDDGIADIVRIADDVEDVDDILKLEVDADFLAVVADEDDVVFGEDGGFGDAVGAAFSAFVADGSWR